MFVSIEMAARKHALAAERDLFHQTLRMELRNLRVHFSYITQRYSRLPAPGPWLKLVMPLTNWWMRRGQRRRVTLPRAVLVALAGIQVYHNLAPLFRMLLTRWNKNRVRVSHRHTGPPTVTLTTM